MINIPNSLLVSKTATPSVDLPSANRSGAPIHRGFDDATEILTATGFKTLAALMPGDSIYLWLNGTMRLVNVSAVLAEHYDGELHFYKGKAFEQLAAPNQPLMVKYRQSQRCTVLTSEVVFNENRARRFPARLVVDNSPSADLTDAQIALAAMVYTDGSFVVRNGSLHSINITKSPNRKPGIQEIKEVCRALNLKFKIRDNYDERYNSRVKRFLFSKEHSKTIAGFVGQKSSIAPAFLAMDIKQALLFLYTWACFDGVEQHMLLQYDNTTIRDQLQHIAYLAGFTSHTISRLRDKTNYVKLSLTSTATPLVRELVRYNGFLRTPVCAPGIAAFRRNGFTFYAPVSD